MCFGMVHLQLQLAACDRMPGNQGMDYEQSFKFTKFRHGLVAAKIITRILKTSIFKSKSKWRSKSTCHVYSYKDHDPNIARAKKILSATLGLVSRISRNLRELISVQSSIACPAPRISRTIVPWYCPI